jgi:hypothetical protein
MLANVSRADYIASGDALSHRQLENCCDRKKMLDKLPIAPIIEPRYINVYILISCLQPNN